MQTIIVYRSLLEIDTVHIGQTRVEIRSEFRRYQSHSAGTGNFSLNTLKIFLSTEKYEQKNFIFKAVLRTD